MEGTEKGRKFSIDVSASQIVKLTENARMHSAEAEECDACSGLSHGAGKRPER